MTSLMHLIIGYVFVCIALGFSCFAQCATRYEVDLFKPPRCQIFGAMPISVRAISENGLIAGSYQNCALGNNPFRWSPNSGLETIALPSETPSGGCRGINSKGQTAGIMAGNGSPRGFFAAATQGIDIGSLGGQQVFARAMNEQGQIIGQSSTEDFTNHAFLYQNGKLIGFDLPIGTTSDARDINEDGDICGWMGTGQVPPSTSHGFLRTSDGQVIDIPPLPGGITLTLRSVNNHREIAGSGSVPDADGEGYVFRGLIWKDGEFIVLEPPPEFQNSTFLHINDNSTIIGAYTNPGTEWFIWQPGSEPLDPNNLIPPDSDLMLITSLGGINNQGQIAGSGFDIKGEPVGFRLTPIPPRTGDADCDDDVDVDDLGEVFINWGPCKKATTCPGDLNADNVVNRDDMMLVFNNWGK